MSENFSDPLFKNYGKRFQEQIFQGLLTDHAWATQVIEVMKADYFDLKYLAFLTDRYFKHFEKYKCFPTMQLLVSIVKEDLKAGPDAILKDQIIDFLTRMRANPDVGDLGYVKEKTLDFCKRQAFREALEKAVEMVATDKFESVVDLMKHAVSVGMPNTVGHDFLEDAEARFVKINRNPCPTGLDVIDSKDILRGGLGRGELGVVVAATGVGKSHWLVAMGAHALKLGKNVVHYTFELTETSVGLRYDSNLCGISSSDVPDRKDEVLKTYETMDLGRLIIKEYPTGAATVQTLRSHIEKLSLKGFIPSLIIIDYADIMRSSRTFDSLRHELKLVYEELRNLAMELNLPIWTASQSNREGSNADVVGLENMSEAYGKAMVADVVMSLSRKPSEKADGSGRLFVAKNRAGKDGVLFPIHIDTSQSRIKVLDENSLTLSESMTQDGSDAKKLLRKKWQEVTGNK
jgi:replicative DNA helicase